MPELVATLGGVWRIAVISDATVAGLHRARISEVLPDAAWIEFPAGEASKSLRRVEQLYDRLAAAGVGRRDLVLTLGGGVAGDLGGFTAATWLRGVRFVQVPTTIEAAVDASVGGKTGVNHAAGKNLIGAFHQPSAVVIDTDLLATLPQRDYVAGLAESVKHGVIRDAEFLRWQAARCDAILGRDSRTLETLIHRNCRIKAEVVGKDEREAGLRAILNYGHTLGHAIEHLVGYELRHGECVALGMLAENAIAVAREALPRGEAEEIAALIAALGLPTRLPRALRIEDVLAAIRMDKKAEGGAVHFVLVSRIGAPQRVSNVLDEEVAAGMEAIRA